MVKIYLKDRINFKVNLAKKGMTASALADKVGIQKTYLSRIMNNDDLSIGTKTAKKIASAFGTDVEDIFSFDNDNKN